MTREDQNIAERDEDTGGRPTEGHAPPEEGSGRERAEYAPDGESPPPSATTEHAGEHQGGVTVPSP